MMNLGGDMAKLKTKIGSGEAVRFDQRDTMYSRPRDPEKSSPEILDIGRRHYGVKHFGKTPGHTMKDWAFSMAMWYLERWWGFGLMVGNEGLLTWFPDQTKRSLRDRMEPGSRWEVSDPEEMSRNIKKAALFLGASFVGICKLAAGGSIRIGSTRIRMNTPQLMTYLKSFNMWSSWPTKCLTC